jgi:peptide/nickel transport system substrate-binding protein
VEKYEVNLAKAGQLLRCRRPEAWRERRTPSLDFDDSALAALTSRQCRSRSAEASAKVGIEVDLRQSPRFPELGAKRLGPCEFDMTTGCRLQLGDPVIGVHRTWLSSDIKPGVIWSNTQSDCQP